MFKEYCNKQSYSQNYSKGIEHSMSETTCVMLFSHVFSYLRVNTILNSVLKISL